MTGSGDGGHEEARTYRFGDVTVETAAFRMLRDGAPVHIEPKALEVLIYLIERRERVVTKQELLDGVWDGVTVTENALTRAIAQIRKVLGDDLQEPRYIQTVPTKGYRFVAEMSPPATAISHEPEASPVVVPAPRRRRGWRWLGVAALLAAVSVLFLLPAILQSAREKRRTQTRAQWEGEVDPPPPMAARPLAPSPRLQAFPTFSPDGAQLAYAADDGRTTHIYTRSVEGGEERQITDGDGETQPSWSADGQWIAFVSALRGGIWKVPATGGEATQLTSFGSRPAWSPDGHEIAFQSSQSIEYGWTTFDASPASTIWIVNTVTRRTEQLTQPGTPAGGHATPAWRADGKRLVLAACDVESFGIWSIARDGTGLTKIVFDTRRLVSPVFSRDGRAVQYVFVRVNRSALMTIPVSSDGAPTAPPTRLRQSDPGVMHQLAISPDGLRLAWSLIEEGSDLFATGPEGGTPVPITRNPVRRATFPAFSPDGTKIAYCAFSAGEDSGIWVADADGKNAKALEVGSGLKQHTHWSRGGWDIFHAKWLGSTSGVVKTSLITGRSAVVVTLPKDASTPVVSPDESSVAFTRNINGVTSVWVDALSGGRLQRLTPDSELARSPIWSPSGEQLAVQVRRADASSGIGIVPSRGGSLRIIETGPMECWPYSWSPDERQVAFAGRVDGAWNIWTVGVAGGQPRRITSNQSTTNWYRSPAWSPAGDRIVYEVDTPNSNVWISEPRVTQ